MKRYACLFVLFAIIGITLALTNKERVLQRLENSERALLKASQNFTSYGLDYFAGVINKTLVRAQFAHEQVSKLSGNGTDPSIEQWLMEMLDIEQAVPELITYPVHREFYKAGGLYLAEIKAHRNDNNEPSPDRLRKEVADIIEQEAILKATPRFPDHTEYDIIKEALDTLYDDLIQETYDDRLPKMGQFHQLKADAEQKLVEYTKHGRKEEAKTLKKTLDEFLEQSFHLGKIFPLDSRTRYNQFLADANAHYQSYAILNVLVFIDDLPTFHPDETSHF